MACNAHNHSPSCPCGFGGDTGGGHQSGWSLRSALSHGWAVDGSGTIESYTTPNAHCPVCGAVVFFYRSPYDGRVFFDALGPPWPKHPCTDNGSDPLRTSGPARAVILVRHELSEDTRWKPFYYARVIRGFKSTRVEGVLQEDRMQVVVLGSKEVDSGPIYLQPLAGAPGLYEISYLRSDKVATREKTAFACDAKFAEAGQELLLRAARGDAEALAEFGRFILYELAKPSWATPYLKRALDSGINDVLFDLAIVALFPD